MPMLTNSAASAPAAISLTTCSGSRSSAFSLSSTFRRRATLREMSSSQKSSLSLLSRGMVPLVRATAADGLLWTAMPNRLPASFARDQRRLRSSSGRHMTCTWQTSRPSLLLCRAAFPINLGCRLSRRASPFSSLSLRKAEAMTLARVLPENVPTLLQSASEHVSCFESSIHDHHVSTYGIILL